MPTPEEIEAAAETRKATRGAYADAELARVEEESSFILAADLAAAGDDEEEQARAADRHARQMEYSIGRATNAKLRAQVHRDREYARAADVRDPPERP